MKIREFISAINEEKRKKERAKSLYNFAVKVGTVIVVCSTVKSMFFQRLRIKALEEFKNNCINGQSNL